MIYNIGTAVPLTWFAGADLGAVSVVVTDPNGLATSLGPVATGAPIGTYNAGTITVTVPGRYVVSWTSTSPLRTWVDVFEVRRSMIYSLVSVADAKQHLRLRKPNEISDDTLAGFIESASIAIKNITGPIIPEQFTEYYDGGGSSVSVDYKPIINGSVTVTEYDGMLQYNLTEQPLGQMNAFGFSVDYSTGLIRRRAYGGNFALFATGAKNIVVTYKAGRDSVPANVQTATKELVRHLWTQTQVPGRRGMPQTGEDGFGIVPVGFAVPNFVVQLLQNDQRPPGIA